MELHLKASKWPVTTTGILANTAPATQNIAALIQDRAPWCPPYVALVAALALTAETVVGLSSLTKLRQMSKGLDQTLDQVTQNFGIAILAACVREGLSHEQFHSVLELAEQAAIADLQEHQTATGARRPEGTSLN